jgi:SAM-dependent methyltransferase
MRQNLIRRLRASLVLLGAAVVVGIGRHGFRARGGHGRPGGELVWNPGVYNAVSRRLLHRFYEQTADDAARAAPAEARILEVGSGPGHLSIQLARRHGFDVTGIDVDPSMIDHARANASHFDGIDGSRPSFQVGPWRWPWKLRITQRVVLVRPGERLRHPERGSGKAPSDEGREHG